MATERKTENNYFNLHIRGLGYVNRIREVNVKKRSDKFWACDISALHGAKEDVEYTKFDCKVSGEEAEKLIQMLQKACDEKKKILIDFKLGDLYTELFTYEKGEKTGQTGISLKTRLLKIYSIRIDGNLVYTAPVANSIDSEPPSENPPSDLGAGEGDDEKFEVKEENTDQVAVASNQDDSESASFERDADDDDELAFDENHAELVDSF